jgi:hypothetical protein
MNKKNILNIVMIILFTIGISFGGYFYYKLNQLKKGINVSNNKEIKSLILKVSKLYLVPEDEVPTLATVTDPEIVKDKSFFTLAEMGDKVFIYAKLGKAILYRPNINKIVEVVSVGVDDKKDMKESENIENKEELNNKNDE